MAIKITRPQGTEDVTPKQIYKWHTVERIARETAENFGFHETRIPTFESTDLFLRSVGETTDVVQKEMYTVKAKETEFTLRPEGTAGTIRSILQNGLLNDALPQKVYYILSCFRHERPQRGRYRQFYQFGCEALGFAGPDVDAEMILMTSRLWKALGIQEVKLEINSLGEPAERAAHREALLKYFEAHQDQLNETAKHRLYLNPLRILDTKDPDMQELANNAPRLIDYLGEKSRAFLAGIEHQLERAGIEYTVNPRLVRGLDYYSHTVFEWTTDRLGSQATICGGGRYDGLMEILGGKPAPCVGFAMGAERVLELMKEFGVKPETPDCSVYVIHAGEGTLDPAVTVAESLRDFDVSTIVHGGEASMKSQMKKADASGAEFAVIIGDTEAANGTVSVKRLRDRGEDARFAHQETLPADDACDTIFSELLALETKDL